MMLSRLAAVLGMLAACFAAEVTPIAKVIDLLQGLQTEVQGEGKREAASYDKYACFCKDETTKKSKSVKKGKDNIDLLSADIADKTQAKKDDATELLERKEEQEKLESDLDASNSRCAKEKSIYEAALADHVKAINSLKKALKAMKDAKPAAASLLAIKHSVVKALAPMSASPMAHKVVGMLQEEVDPNDPSYAFHSDDIVAVCEMLLGDFQKDKQTLDTEWSKTEKSCTSTKASLNKEIKANKEAMDQLKQDMEALAKKIATSREALVTAQGDLEDDSAYLKDLTAQCEERAKDFDQRSDMRKNELSAMSKALQILTKDVQPADTANVRAFVQQATKADSRTAGAKLQHAAAENATSHSWSFLQSASVRQHGQEFLARGRSGSALEQQLEARRNRALSMLRDEGRRIESVMIASLTVSAASNPFKKVKTLIQNLIERLLEESKNEATKKGFCDESLGTAEHDRDSRWDEVNDLNRELVGLKTKKDELTEEVKSLGKSIAEDEKVLNKMSEDRDDEKEENLKTIKTAKDGLDAVAEALQILRDFYSSAARVSAAFLQASPVDEDTSGPGFSDSYRGKQGGMQAVFALLEVIQSDFDRTIRNTEKAESDAHRAFVQMSETTKSDIAGKSTKKELDEQDLKSTKTAMKSKSGDLQTNMDLLDNALKAISALKPTCIDTGMSYKERVAKREDEMKALKKALCILDTDNVEAECSGR